MSTDEATVTKEELKKEMRENESHALEMAMEISKMESEAADRLLKMRIATAIENVWMANIAAVQDVTSKLLDKDESVLKEALTVLGKTANSAANMGSLIETIGGRPLTRKTASEDSSNGFAVSGNQVVRRK